MQVFNPKTQKLEDVVWTADNNNELIANFEDGHFLKFPAGLTKDELQTHVDEVQVANEGQEIITPEMEVAQAEEKAAAENLVAELNGNPMPVSEQSNAPTEETPIG